MSNLLNKKKKNNNNLIGNKESIKHDILLVRGERFK